MGMVRTGQPMLPQQPTQQVPTRYPLNSYYSQPGPMAYPQQTQVPGGPHRSLSQNPLPNYSMTPTSIPSNGTMNKPTLMDTMELKSDDSFDDPSKLQIPQTQQTQVQPQQQQQQMFHPLLQNRSRPQSTGYYPNMPPTANTYYATQRPLAPTPDYTMSVGRGNIRAPSNNYGTMPVQQQQQQQRPYIPSTTNDLTTGINNNPNPMGLQSTPPPPPPPS